MLGVREDKECGNVAEEMNRVILAAAVTLRRLVCACVHVWGGTRGFNGYIRREATSKLKNVHLLILLFFRVLFVVSSFSSILFLFTSVLFRYTPHPTPTVYFDQRKIGFVSKVKEVE